jgi:O-antigen/teichoic acid export membrane protein
MIHRLITKYILNGSYSLALVRLACLGLSLISTVVLARLLGPDIFGVYSYLVNILVITVVIGVFGLQNDSLDKLPKFIIEKDLDIIEYLIKSRVTICLSSFIFGVLAQLSLVFFTEQALNFPVWLIPFTAVFFAITYTNSFALRAFKYFKTSMLFDGAIYAVFIMSISGLIYANDLMNEDLIYRCICLAYLCTALLSSYVLFNVVTKNTNNFNNKNSKKRTYISVVKGGLPFFLLGSVEVLSNNLDILLVSHLFQNSDVAVYAIAKKFILIFSFAFYIFNYKNVVRLSEAFSLGIENQFNKNEIVRNVIAKNRQIFLLTFILGLPLCLFATEVVSYVFGADFVGPKLLYWFVFTFVLVNVAGGPTLSFLNVSGLSHWSVFVIIPGVLVSVLLSFVFSNIFGLSGIGLALTLGLLTWKLLGLILIQIKLGFNISIFSLGK